MSDHPMSLFILSTLHRHGPQSIMSLWHHHKCESLSQLFAEVATLHEDGFIERTPSNQTPGRYQVSKGLVTFWQLTEEGKQRIAAEEAAAARDTNAQEACLGS